MHILIPAGGRGLRLRPLTTYYPKPLLPLGDRPLLTRIVESLPPEMLKTILIPPELEPEFQRWRGSLPRGANVRFYLEPNGTANPAGPVAALSSCVRELGLEDELLVLMGDSLLPFTVAHFRQRIDPGQLRLAAYAVADIRDARRFGVLEVDRDGYVASFEEKPATPRSPWVFTGCLFIPRRLLNSLATATAEHLTQMGHLVSYLLNHGERIQVFPVEQEWNDIGSFASYLKAHRALLPEAHRQQLLAQGNRLGGSVYVHPSATVIDSQLTDSIIFAGANIVNASLTTCIVHQHVTMSGRAVAGKMITAEVELPVSSGSALQ